MTGAEPTEKEPAGDETLPEFTGQVEAALAVAGMVFADLPPVPVVDGCSYCYSPTDLASLGGDPEAVPEDLVRRFAQEVPDHWGHGQYGLLWRRLAPRIVRQVVEQPRVLILPWMLRGPGAAEATWADWPTRHQEVVTDLYSALLRVAVVSWEPGDVVEALDGMAHLPQGLEFWLSQVLSLTGPTADAGLVRLSAELAGTLIGRGDETPGWQWTGADLGPDVARWLASPPVSDRLYRFARAHPDCGTGAWVRSALADLGAEPDEPAYFAVDTSTCRACGFPAAPG